MNTLNAILSKTMTTTFGSMNTEEVKELIPKLLYKYRDWRDDYHKTIITKRQIWFASPEQLQELGDEYDCRHPIEWNWEFDKHRAIIDVGYPNDKTGLTPDEYERILRDIHQDVLGTSERQQTYIDDYYKLTTKLLGILSVSRRNDNLALWQSDLYAKNFRGFCVGYNFRQCLYGLQLKGVGGADVSYVGQDDPKIEHRSSQEAGQAFLAMHLEQINRKFDKYAHEEEYRFTLRAYTKGLDYELTGEDRLFTVPPFCIKSITFGCNMPESEIQEIIAACQEQGIKADFFLASPTDTGEVLLEPYPEPAS